MEPWFAALARPTAAVPSAAAHNNALAWRTSRAGACANEQAPPAQPAAHPSSPKPQPQPPSHPHDDRSLFKRHTTSVVLVTSLLGSGADPRDPSRPADEMRIVQLTPVGSACSIALGTGIVDTPPGSAQGMQLVVSDIEAARAALVERGVEVSEVQHFDGAVRVANRGGDWNSFVFFSDPDGNGWAVQESPAGD